MLHLMIISKSFFPGIFQHALKNPGHIFMHQFTVQRIQNIIGASLFMQSQRQRTAFFSVSKRKFHFIPVGKFLWTSFDIFKLVIRSSLCIYLTAPDQRPVKQFTDLRLLHMKLRLIIHRLVHTTATLRKYGTYRFSYLQWGFFQHFQKSSFHSISPLFIDHKSNSLSRYSIFHHHSLSVYCYFSFIGKFYFFNNPFINLAFFH